MVNFCIFLKGRNYKKREKKKRGRKKSKRGEREVKPGERVPVEIWYTFTCCDVMWQVRLRGLCIHF